MAATPSDDLYRAYWDAIVRRVCSACLDQQNDGSCGLAHGDRMCALRSHLPDVVQTLVEVQSDRMDEYEAAIRAQVCTRCGEAEADGSCGVRDRGECALSTYLSLVVDAVEEVKEGR